MPLPGNLTSIVVTGDAYLTGAGGALAGYFSFAPNVDLTDATGPAVIRTAPVQTSVAAGTMAPVTLVCTDNTDLSPSGWVWTIIERLDAAPARTWSFFLPSTAGSVIDGVRTVDLAALIEVSPGPPLSTLYGVLAEGYTNTWDSTQQFAGPVEVNDGLSIDGTTIPNPPGGTAEFLRADGSWATPAGGASISPATTVQPGTAYATASAVGTDTTYAREDHQHGTPAAPTLSALGGLAAANNLSDLVSAATARGELGLGSAATQASSAFDTAGAAAAALSSAETFATSAVGTETTRAQAAEAARLVIANNLSDLANAATARSSLGLGTAATQATGAFDAAGAASAAQSAAQGFATSAVATETTRAEAAETARLVIANNLSDLASVATARTNLGLGASAQQGATGRVGVLAEVLPAYACSVSGGSTLTAGVLILNLIRPDGPITATNLGVWLTTAGVTASGANGLALYTEAGVLIDQTADLSAIFTTAGYQESPLSLGTQQLSANTSYYIGLLSHYSGTVPRAAAALAGAAIPVIKGHYLSLSKTAMTSFPSSFTPSTLTTSTAAYYMTMS